MKSVKENSVYKEPCFERKIKSEFKLNTEHLLHQLVNLTLTCYTWNTVTTNWRMNYFSWYCLNTTVRKFNISSIGSINAIQKKFVYLHKMGEKIHFKSQRYYCKVILTSAFICQQSNFLFQHGKKTMYTYIIQKFSPTPFFPIRYFYFVS